MLTTDQPNQRALAHRVAEACDLVGVVVSRNIRPSSRSSPRRTHRLVRLGRGVVNRPLRSAWIVTQSNDATRYPGFPDVARWDVDQVNRPATHDAVEIAGADLVLVSGTNLLRQPLIDACNARSVYGTMNLHTGLSPYVRGGPNCTNWCLATAQPWLIGNTVMWIDAGIDSGAIVATECTAIDGSESLAELHRKVIEHAHDLTLRALAAAAAGAASPFPQDGFRDKGTLYLTKHWTAQQMAKAWMFHRVRFAASVNHASFLEARARLELVPIGPGAPGPHSPRS